MILGVNTQAKDDLTTAGTKGNIKADNIMRGEDDSMDMV